MDAVSLHDKRLVNNAAIATGLGNDGIAVMFLLSDAVEFITGRIVPVDGGFVFN